MNNSIIIFGIAIGFIGILLEGAYDTSDFGKNFVSLVGIVLVIIAIILMVAGTFFI